MILQKQTASRAQQHQDHEVECTASSPGANFFLGAVWDFAGVEIEDHGREHGRGEDAGEGCRFFEHRLVPVDYLCASQLVHGRGSLRLP